MTKQDFIKAFAAKGITVKNRAEAGWAAEFMNKNYGTSYRPKDIYLAWKAAA